MANVLMITTYYVYVKFILNDMKEERRKKKLEIKKLQVITRIIYIQSTCI